jgi:UDP-N-acetylglucosamine 2-epimerase (non-hydrolysing)
MTQQESAKILVVAGARPNFMKVVPVLHELDRLKVPRVFVHTGQHYDVKMSEALLRDLRAPEPDVLLEVGSGSHAAQTARVMERFEPVLLEHKPSWVVVVGDVNSTLACALVASKLRHEHGCRVAHVEAGLRSNDWTMPEEVNRVVTDRLSDLLLTPSVDVGPNIDREGLGSIRSVFVGNVMIDSLLAVLPRARAMSAPGKHELSAGSYVLATLHRPSNVDDPQQLELLLRALATVAARHPVLFPMHPRTLQRAEAAGLRHLLGRIRVVEPLGYAEMVGLMDAALATVTDSGGLQEETTVLGVPCVTVRASTERPITVAEGTNRMCAWPPTVESLVNDVEGAIAQGRRPVGSMSPKGWDGRAAERIVSALLHA